MGEVQTGPYQYILVCIRLEGSEMAREYLPDLQRVESELPASHNVWQVGIPHQRVY